MTIAEAVRKRIKALHSVIFPSARGPKLPLAGWRWRRLFTLWRSLAIRMRSCTKWTAKWDLFIFKAFWVRHSHWKTSCMPQQVSYFANPVGFFKLDLILVRIIVTCFQLKPNFFTCISSPFFNQDTVSKLPLKNECFLHAQTTAQ